MQVKKVRVPERALSVSHQGPGVMSAVLKKSEVWMEDKLGARDG